ncbi:type I-U CRISPR-associated helicase/endonuclease Cas3 [Streptomyces sp. NPDC046557]|uniref:type I-G CRISPR-associated helicase/endonuclease Cas3g n=1 Tax=Streptomyces sp. NPDC046557 TaxID=3155372 RepID=UPI0033CE6907
MSLSTEELLQIEEFATFVEEVRGRRPFPWQIAYLHHVAETGIWPDLGIPTGLGKTSIIEIWVFLLAWQHASGVHRTVPLRLFFAVDRRLVVDQTHESSRTLQQALDTSHASTITGRVADALRDLAGSTSPLECVRMRGGVDWASRWLRSPAQPAVITSTVDQFGSRLLFRGYHTSPRMRPIDAALCGMDALLALDEAHIALPLLATATDCAAYQATATHPEFAARALKVVSLSATASSGHDRPRHSITDADRAHPVAGRRLNAPRRLTLLDASSSAKNKAEGFAQAAEQALETLLTVVERPILGVVANTLRAARATHRLLSPREDIDVVLLTGRSRALDRERLLLSRLLTELLTGVAADRTKPLVVIATQTVEVGIDISFASLITENASLAALVQRLGRLDRTGDLSLAPAVVIRVSTATDQSSIPVYGDAAEHTWNWLADRATPLTTTELDPATLAAALPEGLLVNPLTLPGLLDDTDTTLLNVTPPRIPVVHRTLLDSWTRTSPTPVPDQAPAPFLHGLDTTPEDVQVLWRADLQDAENPDFDHWAARMQQVPPHPAETVAIPSAQLRRFLTRSLDTDDTSDLESTPNTQEPIPAGKKQKPPSMSPALSYDQTVGAWMPITDPSGIRPGSTVVLPSHYGGHDTYGWTGTRTLPACDLGDYPPTATTPTRIHAPVLTLLADGNEDLTAALTKTITRAVDLLRTAEHEEATVVHNLLDTLQGHLNQNPDGPYTDLVHNRLGHLRTVKQWTVEPTGRTEHRGRVILDPDEPDRLLLIPPHPPQGQREQGAGVGDESADSSSLTRPVPLSQHSQAVADRTATYATALALPTTLIDTLRTAGHAHDCGKSHNRFQCMLCAGDQLLAESLDEPLAKSGMDPADHTARRRAAKLARWEPEMRHEALSALAVTAWLATAPDHARGDDDELLTHLVAAHHGHARPLLPPVPDPFPQTVTCTMPDQQQVTVKSADMGTDWSGPDRFHALNRRYGPWGLALLEATLRLADMACSEEGT